MEAVNPPTMPSQAQMAYAQRTTALHSRSHATPSNADSSASSSPYKSSRLPPLPPAPSSHQQYANSVAGAGGGGATVTQQAPGAAAAAVRFVSHLHATNHAAASQQLHYSPRYNHTMIVRDSIPPPGSRLDNSSGPPPSQIRNRFPLLAAQQYLTSPAHGNEHGGSGGLVISLPSIDLNPPAKKLRLSEGPILAPPPGLVKSDPHQPLRIDTRDHNPNTGTVLRGGGGGGSVYNPQVEAISPTLPPDPVKPEDTTLKTVKDDLIGKIGKVDKDIASTETLVNDLKAKEKALEETLKKLLEDQEAVKPRPPSLSLAQKVYKSNRELAQESHTTMSRLGPPIDLPIYNQPSDSPTYQLLRERHAEFRPRLVELIRKRKQEEASRQNKLTESYCTLAAQWFKKVDKIENSSKRKAREAKAREVYEKMFPEIRKNREDKERFSRVGARVKSDADLAEIMDGLQEQEAEDRRRHSLSVIPPIITDRSRPGRAPNFINNNGRVLDYEAEMSARAQVKMWTASERELFRDKYIHHQKNFGLIASFLERKTPADCVEYYYLSKKRENYKRAIRYNKSRARTRGNKLTKGAHVNNLNSSLPPLDPIFNNTGVTTRLQREQLIKQEPRVKQDREKNSNSTNSNTEKDSKSQPDSSASSTPVKEEKQRGVTPVPSVVPPAPTQQPPVSSSCDNPPTTTSSPPFTSTPTSTTTLSSTTGLLTTTTLQRNSTSPAATSNPASSISSSHPPPPSSSNSNSTMSSSSSSTTITTSSHYNHPKSSIAPSIPSSNSFNLSSTSSTNSTIPSSLHNHYPPPPVSSPGGLRRPPLGSGVPPGGGGGANVVPTSLMNHHHHHHHAGIGELRLEMKKKERRKEDKKRDGEFDDTSDDEAQDNQEADKPRLPHECHVCHKLVTVSRRLLRSHAVQYGLTEDDIPPADTMPPARVCLACRAQARHRFTVCPIPSCVNHSSSRAKRLRALPSKFHSLPPQLKSTLASEFQISPSITKCCSLCYTRVQKRLLAMGIEDASSRPVSPSSGATSPLLRWTEEETELLKKGLRECGTKWSEVSAIVGPSKTMHQCKSFYLSYRKNLGLDLLVQEYNKNHFGSERKPVLTDEEESGSSTSSCDGLLAGPGGAGAGLIDSDTTSAPSPSLGPKQSPLCPPRVSESSDTTGSLPPSTHRGTPNRTSSNQAPPTRLGEDYDSSATETADEGTTEHGGTTSSPLTVKDLMLGVIEISLKNSAPSLADPNAQGNTKSNPPTISSILKTSEPGPNLQPGPGQLGQGPPPPHQPQSKPLSMVQHRSNPPPTEAEPVTLDLSIKKPRSNADPPYPPPNKPTPTLTLPQHVSAMYRPAPEKGGAGPPGAYYHLEVGGRRTPDMYGAPGPAGMMSGGPHPRPPTPSHMKPNKVRITSLSPGQHHQQQATQRLSPSQSQQGGGVKLTVLPPRHAPGPPPDPRYSHSDSLGGMKDSGGSITQGTPVHSRLYPPPPNDRGGPPPPPEFYGKPSPSQPGSGGPSPAHRSSEPLPQPRSSSNPPPPSGSSPFYPPRAPSSSNEQQQILMNDYITAKHMTGVSPTPPRGPRDKGTPPAQAPPNVSPGGANSAAAAMFYQPTRQGVIQRHNTSKPPSPHFPPPPGHEAFSSLVETAVRQPSLPVPGGPSDHHKDRLQSALAHHEGLGQRFNNHDRYPPPPTIQRDAQERFARESAAAHQQQQREIQQARDREIQRERELIAARELVAAQAQAQARDRELQQLRDQAILREHTIRELQRREEQQKAMIRDSQLLQQQQREREIMHIREREIMAEHMAAQRSRLSSEQARMHQMQMAVFQQQQQHHHAATVAAVAAAQQQRERAPAVARLNSSPHDRRMNASPLENRGGKGGGGTSIGGSERSSSNQRGTSIGGSIGGSERSSSNQSGASMGSNGGVDGKHGQGGDTRPQLVTAASLIDAIITHQINQPVDQGGPGPGERGHLPSPQSGMMNQSNSASGNRAGDRLFQVDFNQKKVSVSPRLDISSNGKVSPATASIMSRAQGGLKLSSPGGDKPPPGQMTLNEQIESMMRHGGPPPGPHNLTASPYETQAWKLRRALAKEEEQHHQHHRKQGSSPAGMQSSPGPPQGVGPRYYGDPVPTMSPLDYVKNRIAEVMRTSEEDKGPGGDDDGSPHLTPSPQGGRHMMVPSPYSMMQQSPGNRPPSRPVTGPPVHHPPPMHDPGKPLMSDQFEALSDDD
uniref:Nuclear receptor corepressor 1 n=1 Tax=Cacopsylla melanoneura TaxID=428564 RepID=A0A8D8UCU2_9HEMI